MTTSSLLPELRLEEGCSLSAYPDVLSPLAQACKAAHIDHRHYDRLPNWRALSGDPWTIGDGVTGPDVKPGVVWTQAQADAAKVAKVNEKCAQLDAALPWWRRLDPVRQDVVVILAFNLGVHGLCAFTETLGALRIGAYAASAAHLLANAKWVGQVGQPRADRIAFLIENGRYPPA